MLLLLLPPVAGSGHTVDNCAVVNVCSSVVCSGLVSVCNSAHQWWPADLICLCRFASMKLRWLSVLLKRFVSYFVTQLLSYLYILHSVTKPHNQCSFKPPVIGCKTTVWLGSYLFGLPETVSFLTLSLPIPLRLCTLPCCSNPPFLIFDIWVLWSSGLSSRAPKCQKLKMVG